MCRTASKAAIVILAAGSLLSTARAAIIERDSSNFAWKYEMGAKPSDEDLDANATDDFTEWPGSAARAACNRNISEARSRTASETLSF